ncbi:MAG: hypothetical protein ACI9J3_001992 [Parvicellaceae bacterium]
MKGISYIFLVFILFGCGDLDPNAGRTKLAQVGEKFLYLDELIEEVPIGMSKEDSASFVIQFVEKWTKEEAIIQKAKQELPEEALNVEKQLKDYEKSLIIYAYEKELIKKKLDTVVSGEEIQEYYLKNQENFKLQDYIVKVFYLKVGLDAPKLDEVRKWYKLSKEENVEALLSYAPVHAVNYYYNEENWVYFDDVLKVIPLTDINKPSFIRNKRKITFQEDDFVYFLNIMDYKLKDAVSPLSLESEKIKSIILNIRANELKKKIREELHNEAKRSQSIKTF